MYARKIRFCKSISIDLLFSQSCSHDVHAIYSNALNCDVSWVLIQELIWMFLTIKMLLRYVTDIGYRSYPNPVYLANNEKN